MPPTPVEQYYVMALGHRDRAGLVHDAAQVREPVLALDHERDAELRELCRVAPGGDRQDDGAVDVVAVRAALGQLVQHRVEAVQHRAEGEVDRRARRVDVVLIGPGREGAVVGLGPAVEVLDGAVGDLGDQRLPPVSGRFGQLLALGRGAAQAGAHVPVGTDRRGGGATGVGPLPPLAVAPDLVLHVRGEDALAAHVNHSPCFS